MHDQQRQSRPVNVLSTVTFSRAYSLNTWNTDALLRLTEPPVMGDMVGALYDAVHNDAKWREAMEQFGLLLNCTQVCLLVLEKKTGSVVLEEQYGAASIPFRLGDDALSRIARHPARDEWVAEGGLLWLTFENYDGALLSMVFSGRLDSWEIHALVPLTWHLQRAVQLRLRFKKATERTELQLMLLDRLTSVLLVVDASGEVLVSNRAAKLWMQEIQPTGSKIDQLTLQLKTLAGKIFRGDHAAPVFTMKHHLSTAEDWYFLGLPLLGNGPGGAFVRAAAVLVHEGGQGITACADFFRGLFGLSPAEAGLLACLVKHDSLHCCAASLGISKETARSHLKSIYRKTGVNKQSSLIRLIVHLSQLHGADDPGSTLLSQGAMTP